MKQFLSKLYYNSSFIHHVMQPFAHGFEYMRYGFTPDRVKIKREFKKNLGYKLNLSEPETLNEKIQWLKLHDRTALHTKCADKFSVRAYVFDKVGDRYLIPLVYQTKKVRNIISENIPDYPIIIKTNHDSSGGIIVRDKSHVNWDLVQKKLNKNLSVNYYYRFKEWQYKHIEKRIIVEKLLTDNQGAVPFDYKFHCFHGKVVFIQVDIDRFTIHKRNMYDRNWKLLPFNWCNFVDGKPKLENGKLLKKPESLDEMIAVSEKLSEPFKYVRIDLYDLEGDIYFGEVTFHPCSGAKVIHPVEWDYKLGAMIDLQNE
ncbi:ATP-grasp fold amidoligase family protein [Corallibacter sp.]|uniref:ATP-grasp fold amidoligase family protein n=1 Tax=Corallibacter sp. TaxID=2038084 RepID=UPI003AB59DA4